jgi:hypothetical protein
MYGGVVGSRSPGGQTYSWESAQLKSDVLLANNTAIVVAFSMWCFAN